MDGRNNLYQTKEQREEMAVKLSKTHEHPVEMHKIRQNHVSTVMLHGVSIVALVIDAKERLCLAQISNTLLKKYSYNEIHNRRVALGITCVQCTPVQLEILRRAGAMPVSSRRCGMITMREAERLVKSFLDETAPPSLPENFSFDVKHKCGWGCRGNFIPSRYNSSRAKCIKCAYCNLFFSPNKFIFHFHRVPESKYTHPDAANFNSWRRHVTLYDDEADEEMMHMWEDVKAMFNGGCRKRIITSNPNTETNTHQVINNFNKKARIEEDPGLKSLGPSYPMPVYIPSNKTSQFVPSSPFDLRNKMVEQNHLMAPMWPTLQPGFYSPLDTLWSKQLGVPTIERHNSDKSRLSKVRSQSSEVEGQNRHLDMYYNSFEHNLGRRDLLSLGAKDKIHHMSAFKPVFGHPYLRSLSPSKSCNEKSHMHSPGSSMEGTVSHDDDESENEHVDVDTVDEPMMEENNNTRPKSSFCSIDNKIHEIHADSTTEVTENKDNIRSQPSKKSTSRSPFPESEDEEDDEEIPVTNNEDVPTEHHHKEANIEAISKPSDESKDVTSLSEEELREILKEEMAARKRLEADCKILKESLLGKTTKVISKGDLTQELQVIKEAFYKELEQERTIRLTLQEKLKEAHSALHNFSCSMLATCKCTSCHQNIPFKTHE